MQYPAMNRSREYRVSVPELNGGVNVSVPPHLIADNQLADIRNMWYRDGVLKTRPRLVGRAAGTFNEKAYFRSGSIGPYGYILHDDAGYASIVNNEGAFLWVASLGGGTLMPAALNGKVFDRCSDRSMLLYHRSNAEPDNSGVYILGKDSDNNWAKDESGEQVQGRTEKLDPYVPAVMMNGRPQATPLGEAKGDQFEPYNMLCDEYICKFTPDGENGYFMLPFKGDTVVEITTHFFSDATGEYETIKHSLSYNEEKDIYINTVGNVTTNSAVYSPTLGAVWFYRNDIEVGNGTPNPDVAEAFPKGTDNSIIVRMRRKRDDFTASRNTILNMRFSEWFGGDAEGLSGGTRLFVSGNPDKPNLVHWSALNDPTYFPENNYAYVGDANGAVTAFGKQSNMLVIFKTDGVYYTTYNRGATVTAEDIETQRVVDIEAAAAVFPMIEISNGLGCDCPATVQLCNNRLVWLNSDGRVYGLFSAGAYSERNLRVLSLQIEKKLRAFSKEVLRAASATCYEDHYLLLIDNQIFAMDYSSYGFSYYSSFSTDEKAQKNVAWYCWDTDTKLDTVVSVGDKVVLLGLQEYPDGPDEDKEKDHYIALYVLGYDEKCEDAKFEEIDNNEGKFSYTPITSRFVTKLYDFGRPDRLKRVNSLYLQVSGTQGKRAFLSYLNGNAAYANRDSLLLTGEAPEAAAPFRVTPNMLRVRQFGVAVESTANIAVGGIVLNYSMMGAMR